MAALPGGSTTGATRGGDAERHRAGERADAHDAAGLDGETLFPSAAWPTDGYFAPRRGLIFNGEAIDIIHLPAAHSDGDSAVYFRGSNVLVTGDVFTTTSLPLVNRRSAAPMPGMLAALNTLLDITVPDDLMKAAPTSFPAMAASATKRTSSNIATWCRSSATA